VKLGKKHPDPVVETASLSSVAPTDVWYKLSLPEDTVKTGALSALQLEAVTYAAQQHEHFLPDGSRAGFLIGVYPVLQVWGTMCARVWELVEGLTAV
jgi:hypothetical protein